MFSWNTKKNVHPFVGVLLHEKANCFQEKSLNFLLDYLLTETTKDKIAIYYSNPEHSPIPNDITYKVLLRVNITKKIHCSVLY